MDCVFCKIINKEMNANVVYEDERFIAFHDIAPIAPIHILIIPKEHYTSVLEVNDAEFIGQAFIIAKKIADELGLTESGCRLITNAGEDSGQTVFHWHVHLVGGRKLGIMCGDA